MSTIYGGNFKVFEALYGVVVYRSSIPAVRLLVVVCPNLVAIIVVEV